MSSNGLPLLLASSALVLLGGVVSLLSPPAAQSGPRDRGASTDSSVSREPSGEQRSRRVRSWTDAHRVADFEHRPPDPRCDIQPMLSDLVQDEAFRLYRDARSELDRISNEEAVELGDGIFEYLSTNPGSPYRGQIDRAGTERLRRYLQSLLDYLIEERIDSGLSYRVHVVSDDVANAFTTVGGRIYVTTGLLGEGGLARNEAELLGVLAHEVAHNELRHVSMQVEIAREAFGDGADAERAALANLLRVLDAPWSSSSEDEADAFAVEALYALSYSPWAYEQLWWRQAQQRPADRPGRGGIGSDNPVDTALEQEWRNLTRSHNDPVTRACLAREHTDEFVRDGERDALYVGARNFSEMRTRQEGAY